MKPSRGLRPGATGSRSAGSLSASQRVLGRILRRPLGLVPTATPGGSVTHLNTRFMRNGIVMLVLVAATSALLYALIQPAQSSAKAYSDFYANVTAGKVDKVSILSLIHISEPTRLGMISYAVFCLK